ncbi:hypothetical protein FRC01_002149, partial [Tulasnella sp. 417]
HHKGIDPPKPPGIPTLPEDKQAQQQLLGPQSPKDEQGESQEVVESAQEQEAQADASAKTQRLDLQTKMLRSHLQSQHQDAVQKFTHK